MPRYRVAHKKEMPDLSVRHRAVRLAFIVIAGPTVADRPARQACYFFFLAFFLAAFFFATLRMGFFAIAFAGFLLAVLRLVAIALSSWCCTGACNLAESRRLVTADDKFRSAL